MKKEKTYPLNIGAALKIFALLGFAFFFIFIVATGSVTLYVHPRIIPFMIFAAAVMMVMAVLMIRDLAKPFAFSKGVLGLLFFVVPMLLAVIFPAQSFDANAATMGDVSLTGEALAGSGQSGGQSDGSYSTQAPKASPSPGATRTAAAARTPAPSKQIIGQDGVIHMDSDSFYDCMVAVYDDPEGYMGTPIEVVGFVFNDNASFDGSMFVPARMMMVCCAADMVPMGFLCLYDGASELEAGDWVKVTGVIDQTQYEGQSIPCISAETVVTAQKPADDYIYPSS